MIKRCMYMCAAVLLVLSSVFILVTPSVFASDSMPFFQLVYQTSSDNGTTWGNTSYMSVQESSISSGGLTVVNLISATDIKILGLRCFLGNTKNSEFWFSFTVGGYYGYTYKAIAGTKEPPIINLSIQNASVGAKSGIAYSSVGGSQSNNAVWYVYINSSPQPISPPDLILQYAKADHDPSIWNGFPDSYDYSGWLGNSGVNGTLRTLFVRFRSNINTDSNTQSYFEFNSPIILDLTVNQGTNCIFQYGTCIIDCSFMQNNNFFFDTWFNNITNTLNSQHNALMSKLTTYFADTQNIYTWQEIHNTEEGSEMISQTGNWWSAMLGQLRSLNNDAQTQWEEQEKARNAGAMDALDQGFDSADSHDVFGSSINMFGMGEMGSYNDDTVSEWGGDGFLEWFSARTRDDLDQVPLTRRNPNDNYISFYSDHIDEILSMLGVDEQRGDNPTYYRGD